MSVVPSPMMAPDFEAEGQKARYAAWLKAKLDRAKNSTKPLVPHANVMAQARALLESKKNTRAAD